MPFKHKTNTLKARNSKFDLFWYIRGKSFFFFLPIVLTYIVCRITVAYLSKCIDLCVNIQSPSCQGTKIVPWQDVPKNAIRRFEREKPFSFLGDYSIQQNIQLRCTYSAAVLTEISPWPRHFFDSDCLALPLPLISMCILHVCCHLKKWITLISKWPIITRINSTPSAHLESRPNLKTKSQTLILSQLCPLSHWKVSIISINSCFLTVLKREKIQHWAWWLLRNRQLEKRLESAKSIYLIEDYKIHTRILYI